VDLIFNPKFTLPLLGKAKAVMVVHGADWFLEESKELYSLPDRPLHAPGDATLLLACQCRHLGLGVQHPRVRRAPARQRGEAAHDPLLREPDLPPHRGRVGA
jgi:hypothetical protein